MRDLIVFGSAVLAAAAPLDAVAQGLVGRADRPSLGAVPDQYICVYRRDAVLPLSVRASAQGIASRERAQLAHVYESAIRGFAFRGSLTAAARIQANNPAIAFCEQDQFVEALGKVDALANPGDVTTQADTIPWGIARVDGGVNYTGTARAWVIDTGVDLNHPDLNVDRTRSRSFVSSERSADDGNGHGTHVAGTIAARANGSGVIGVAAGAPVVAVKVLSRSGSGTNSGVIAGVDYVAQNGSAGDVANMSLGGGASSALDSAVVNAAARGIRFALAAGNSSTSATTSSPARVNGTNIFTVSSFANGDRWSSFSNFGNPPIDWAEPGSSIYSTYRNGGYATLSGTSMATPHLAGLLLLGTIRDGGAVIGDPDGNPDRIGVR